LSTKVSRRYELPTCLLEVWTERSPLSDWQSQIVAQNLQFRLKLSYSKKIIKGNQQQITNLIEAVTTYCDRWLAQDDFDSLDHAIAVPQLSKIKLSTLQLFDLYESLELCANEFVILPNVLLEVRRITPNWLKIMAAAIAIVGVSIGTIRLISREQPSYQLASTPAASAPEIAPKIVTESAPEKSANAPSASSNSKLENNSKSDSSSNLKDKDSLKSPRQIPSSSNPAEPKENSAARTSQSNQGLNQIAKSRERTDKGAIAPEPIITGRVNTEQKNPTDQKSVNSPVQQSPRLESSSQDTSPMGTIAESAKPAAPSAKIAAPSTTSLAADSNTAITTNIKVLQIQSELSSDITNDLVRYLQSQRITRFDSGTIALELEISGDRISNISIQNQNSTLKDATAIAEIEKVILKWRSANSVTGKIYLVLQL
jgi:hypothetical protein